VSPPPFYLAPVSCPCSSSCSGSDDCPESSSDSDSSSTFPDAPLDVADIIIDLPIQLSATDLTKWLPETILSPARSLLRPVLLHRLSPPEPIQLAARVKDADNHRSEAVSEINGLAIPAMLEVRCGLANTMLVQVPTEGGSDEGEVDGTVTDMVRDTKAAVEEEESKDSCTSSMYMQLVEASKDAGDKMHHAIKKRFLALPSPTADKPCEYFLELAALYLAGACPSSKGFISKVLQIKSFNWMTPSQASSCLHVLSAAVSDCNKGAYFEYGLQENVYWEHEKKHIVVLGAVDILTPTVLWEVKCVSQLSDVHFLQLAVYAWIWKRTQQVGGLRYM
jgi:hypothetical protein